MPSAVDQLVNGYETSSPVDWADYYNAYGRDHSSSWTNANPDSLGAKINNWFTGDADAARSAYENYLNEYKNHRDTKAQQSEWAREDSSVQRAVADIMKAGLNPWLALNGGSMSSAVNASSSAPVRYQVKEQQLKSKQGKNNAGQLLGTAIKLIAMIALLG